ncbi:PRC-barrel domain-containing protein [Sphingomonas sp. HF-S4]|uniref:PRC-barrel domain-containing protein n=1 Tax=Sphingomonas agrestis TaxID=3080540 RepID=A0ABU3Y631_9SPHN|nr:PRC-barrel domain-containing protein [Sphingomonas sp. HF-S4]MDV3456861.1 PRC-barrel domain-containing protein [Sphingomonas sp. HF-S4]
MIAAMMTAANLGARVTGWGFVVFAVGSVCWSIVGFGSGQTNLVATNLFLTLVNLVGIWRWLGRQRAYEDGAKTATHASRRSSAPSLFTATGLAGMPVADRGGEVIGKSVEALIECASGSVSYVVVASGGIGGVDEQLRAVPRGRIAFSGERLVLDLPRQAFETLPVLAPGEWPARASGAEAAA